MPSRRTRPTLVERGVLTEPRDATPGRHCWVVDPPGLPGRWPGLLVEWRRRDDAWQGLVTFVAGAAGHHMLRQEWLDARCLQSV